MSQRPISNYSTKTRRIASKVTLEELGIDMESNANTRSGMTTNPILNSPPPLAKNNIENRELELSRMEKELQQIVDIQLNVFQKRNSIYEQLAEVRIFCYFIYISIFYQV